MGVKGWIKIVEQDAVHDGPGLRALVFLMFLKGCHLRCGWCQNPELLSFRPEIWFHKLRCKRDGLCEEACPVGAITPDNDRRIDIKKCLGVDCSRCVQVCPQKAFEVVGYEITAEELYEELAKYRIFYDHSGGGVTLTGGEPLHQLEFTVEALRLCQQGGIQTAIETSLYADYEDVWKAAQHCDVLLCDIKHMDDDKHRRGTGVPNELILENFKRLNQDYKKDIAIRIALIPGYNDDEENVTRTMEFVNPLQQVKGVDLLPFNVFPIAKYNALSWDWEYKGVKGQSGEHLARLEEIVKSYKRFRCTIGGLW